MSAAPPGPAPLRRLEAARCTLEPQVAAHAHEMFVVLADPAIYEFENQPPPSPAWLAERYARLERRCSPDGGERWLNWVVRLPDGALAGYVQATVRPSGVAFVAYELASRHWRQGVGRCAVGAMLAELRLQYDVHQFAAVLRRANHRSLGLLRRLGFEEASPAQRLAFEAGPDELVMVRPAGTEGTGDGDGGD